MTAEQSRKFLFRFLKEHGVYRRFLTYIANKRHHNVQRTIITRDTYPIEWCIKRWGATGIISTLLTWDTTKEGFSFWDNLSYEFDKELENKKRALKNGNK